MREIEREGERKKSSDSDQSSCSGDKMTFEVIGHWIDNLTPVWMNYISMKEFASLYYHEHDDIL